MSKQDNDTINKELKNPFEAQAKKGQERTLKYCAWEVLRDHPRGLHVSELVREIRNRGLKDFTKNKNASGQVAGDLVRGKDVFWHDPNQKLWRIRSLVPIHNEDTYDSSTEDRLPHGLELVGHRVAVWWDGDQQFYDGIFRSFDSETNTYSVDYDDGDDDPRMKLRKYKVEYDGDRISVVTVYEHNLDDSDDDDNDDASVASEDEFGKKLRLDGSRLESRDSKSLGVISNQHQKGNDHSTEEISVQSGREKQEQKQDTNSDIEAPNQRKRKNSPLKDDAEFKKFKKEEVPETKAEAVVAVMEEDSASPLGQYISKPPSSKTSSNLNQHHYQEQAVQNQGPNEDSKASIGNQVKSPLPKNRSKEMIDVLGLSKQLQPQKHERPDIKNLTEFGELMSLSELSNELRALDNKVYMEDEVSSKWRPNEDIKMKEEEEEEEEQPQAPEKFNPDHRMADDNDERNAFLEKVPPCYKDYVSSGNVESRLLTSLGSSSPPSSSGEIKRMDNLVPNRRDSLLCSPPVLSRAPRL